MLYVCILPPGPPPVYSQVVDVVGLGVGEAVETLPPLAVRAPSLGGRLHALKH